MNSTMKYKNFIAAINYDGDDKIFWGEILGINDTIAFHGTSVQELEEKFHLYADEYIELCKQKGIKPDKTYSGNFNIRIEPEEHRTAAYCAAVEKISLNQYVGKAIARLNRDVLKTV